MLKSSHFMVVPMRENTFTMVARFGYKPLNSASSDRMKLGSVGVFAVGDVLRRYRAVSIPLGLVNGRLA